jgi:mannose-6-phosphate isomerase-like protein (cupin superfamily)
MKSTNKRWGGETILWHGGYLAKILAILPGKATSMHRHLCKVETVYVLKGTLEIAFDPPAEIELCGQWVTCDLVEMEPGDFCTILEQTPHSMRSVEGAKYFEASTPFANDSERSYLCDSWSPNTGVGSLPDDIPKRTA